MRLPRLHVVTDATIMGAPTFEARALSLLDALGPAVALHLRAPGLATRELLRCATVLAAAALQAGALLLVNERVDIALACRCGAHLNARSVPVIEARRLLHNAALGYSAHTADEAAIAEVEGADFVFTGSIYPTSSHPDHPPAGLDLVQRTAARVRVPVIAIGGVTADRAAEVRQAGAYGAAVIRAAWEAEDPVRATRELVAALEV